MEYIPEDKIALRIEAIFCLMNNGWRQNEAEDVVRPIDYPGRDKSLIVRYEDKW